MKDRIEKVEVFIQSLRLDSSPHNSSAHNILKTLLSSRLTMKKYNQEEKRIRCTAEPHCVCKISVSTNSNMRKTRTVSE